MTRAADQLTRALRRALAGATPGGLAAEARIGVACSGGADSLALAHVAHGIWGDRVVVLHIDHGLQAGSAEVGARVAAWAASLGMHALVREIVVERNGSLEAAARKARYAALAQLQAELGLAWVMTAHTERDVAETVLMRLLRGTDLAGLRTIAPRRGIYLRPWLAMPRAAVEAYVKAHALPVWDDPMNEDRAMLRPRLRLDIMPMLAREQPSVVASLAAVSRQLDAWYRAARPLRRHWWQRVVAPGGELDAQQLRLTPPALARWVVARWLRRASGHGATRRHREAVLAMCASDETKQLNVAGGVVRKEFSTIAFIADATLVPPADASRAAAPPFAPPAGYAWRHWRAGDKMRPLRLRGRSGKLSDLFAQARVPASRRASAWVLVNQQSREIAWAEHVGAAFDAPVGPQNVTSRPNG
ncbi:MAG: tRNA lysidine(34) synthetase TilS [Myxococcales bacterium]|nr:tRNA lysidine(34) synthetase TilS [Myxococcales bacterium]